MSTEVLRESVPGAGGTEGALELTALGKRLEILRIERGVSKQHLARHAGTSRQQLWRVMTGKSELTGTLRERLAVALAVEPRLLQQTIVADAPPPHPAAAASLEVGPPDLRDFLADATHLSVTLGTLPAGDGGRRLKRALLTAFEDLAMDAGEPLPLDYSEIRRRAIAGDL